MAVTNDMSADRRVARHAATLHEAGCEVTVVCRRRGEDLLGPVDYGEEVSGDYAFERISTRHRRGWRFYAEYNFALRHRLLGMKPDVVWANDMDTLPGCWLAARRLRCPLVMDAHELFSEVPEIQHKPVVKWVWRTLERMLMPRCNALLTVCQSVADYYGEKYGVKMEVVRNIQPHPRPLSERVGSEWRDLANYSTLFGRGAGGEVILLYQGSVNYGRGVDWAIDALEYLPQCRLVVAGRGDLLEQMKAYAAAKPWAERVQFLGQVAPSELPALTRQAAVGLVMLEDLGLNYHFALPNRIGDFVAAGVPMVVSDLPEMAAVVRRYGVGEVIENEKGESKNEKARALAETVERVLAREWTEADFAEARKDMDWNKEKQKLIQLCYTTFC